MALATALTKLLKIEHPILLAPMDVVADARLTAAVSGAGGFGILGGGYGNGEWLARELPLLAASGQRFGVGFITWSLQKQEPLLDLVLEHRPAAVMLSFGDPASLVPRIHRAGALVICQVQTLAMAKEALAAGADILVAQGMEAGGHGAARGLFTLLPEVVDAAGKTPVVAAGGIADGRAMAAAMMLGASGVLMGTRFYATDESPAAAAAKERVCRAGGDDSVRSIVFDISRRNVWPAPFTGRCLRNAYLQRWLGREVELMQNIGAEADRYARARSDGDFDVAAVIAGEAAAFVKEVLPAATIVQRVAADAEALLGKRVAA
ncbi:NAD(P)H-dependent flavin oxidoreductase [Ramlibacter sp. PS4R-6]|uniref:NAD(P)H-dependent flavin oxidoreductase n=1 Tax=Ramlibacter sp. PS4R-6 TaxID=3133438 RepID=UPI0030954E5F